MSRKARGASDFSAYIHVSRSLAQGSPPRLIQLESEADTQSDRGAQGQQQHTFIMEGPNAPEEKTRRKSGASTGHIACDFCRRKRLTIFSVFLADPRQRESSAAQAVSRAARPASLEIRNALTFPSCGDAGQGKRGTRSERGAGHALRLPTMSWRTRTPCPSVPRYAGEERAREGDRPPSCLCSTTRSHRRRRITMRRGTRKTLLGAHRLSASPQEKHTCDRAMTSLLKEGSLVQRSRPHPNTACLSVARRISAKVSDMR